MRVISQDRRYSFDFDRASFLIQENYISALFAGENRYILIGRYETEERAEEVFKEMHNAYNGYGLLHYMDYDVRSNGAIPVPLPFIECHSKTDKNKEEVSFCAGEHYVYYMPEE